MGGSAAVQEYYKLYVLPGLFHGDSNGSANREANPPAPAAYQTFQALVNWIENGVSPDTMVFHSPARGSALPWWPGFAPVEGVEMSLPACAYPTIATHTGGDIYKASSYTCRYTSSCYWLKTTASTSVKMEKGPCQGGLK